MVSFFWSTPTWDLTRSNKVQVLDPTDVGCNGSHLTMMIVTLIFNLAVLFHVTLLALSALGVLVTLINSNLVRRTYNVPAWLVCMVQGRAGSFLCTGSSNSLVNTFPEKILFDTSLYLMETTITRNRNFLVHLDLVWTDLVLPCIWSILVGYRPLKFLVMRVGYCKWTSEEIRLRWIWCRIRSVPWKFKMNFTRTLKADPPAQWPTWCKRRIWLRLLQLPCANWFMLDRIGTRCEHLFFQSDHNNPSLILKLLLMLWKTQKSWYEINEVILLLWKSHILTDHHFSTRYWIWKKGYMKNFETRSCLASGYWNRFMY